MALTSKTMAKRLINKSRIKRLSTFPWELGVRLKDLPKANFEELNQVVQRIEMTALGDLSIEDQKLAAEQQDMVLERFLELHDEMIDPVLEDEAEATAPASTNSGPKVYEYMAEPEWVDQIHPSLARDEQAAAVELADEDVLACVWMAEDGYFLIDATEIKTFPFKTVFISADPEDNNKHLALFDDDQN